MAIERTRPADAATAAKKPAGTRERLIAAAFKVVARQGVDGASVKAIAAQAGVTPGLLHYHFPTREALLEAALRQAQADYLARSRRRRLTTPASQLLSESFSSARTLARRDSDLFRVRLAFAAKALSSSALARLVAEINRTSIAETAEMLAAARGATLAAEPDLALAAVLKAAFDGLMLAWLNDATFPIEAAAGMLEGAVRDRLKAITRAPAANG